MSRGATPFDLYDRALGGKLRSILRELRTEGLTSVEATHRLYRDHDINIGVETMRRWYARVDAETGRAKDAS